jgi:hypothetical protein
LAEVFGEDIEDTSTARGVLRGLRRILRPISDTEFRRRANDAVAQLSSEEGGEELAQELGGVTDPFDAMVQELADRCSLAMSESQGAPETRYLAGALPIPSLDSWVLQTVSMEPILVMSHGLLTFCNLFAKSVATLFPCREDSEGFAFDLDPGDSPEFRANQLKAAERLGDLLAATVSYGNPHLAEPYLLQGPQGRLAAIIRGSMERFLMARLVCLAGREVLPCIPCREWTSKLGAHVMKATPEPEDVIEADALGLFATEFLMGVDGVSRALGCWGVDLALAGLQIVEMSRKGAGFPTADDDIDLATRRDLLRELLREREDTMDGVSDILELWDRGAAMITDLSELLQPHYKHHCRRIGDVLGDCVESNSHAPPAAATPPQRQRSKARKKGIHPVVDPPEIPESGAVQWGDEREFVTSRDGKWGVARVQRWADDERRQLWRDGEAKFIFDGASRFDRDFAISNDGFIGFKLTAKFDSDNLFHETRIVVLSPSGDCIFNKLVHAEIDEVGVTHDERVLWFLSGYSKKVGTHDNACFCVDLATGKLIYNGSRFAGPVTNSGYDDQDGQWGRTLWFEGTWKSGVRITK